jgi:hypothetical protein
MAKQFIVQLSDRARFWLFLFIKGTVKPKDNQAGVLLRGVWETFKLQELQDRADDLSEGQSMKPRDFSNDLNDYPIGSVDINTAMGYLDTPHQNADYSLALVPIYEEMNRAKQNKPRLTEVPAEQGV